MPSTPICCELKRNIQNAIDSVTLMQKRYLQISETLCNIGTKGVEDIRSPNSGDSTTPSSSSEPLPMEILGLHNAVAQFRDVPPELIFTVRKLHNVKDAEPTILLSRYFSVYSPVSKIILLPSRRRCGRSRASSTGFVIMQDPFAVKRIVDQLLHEVAQDCFIETSRFEFPEF